MNISKEYVAVAMTIASLLSTACGRAGQTSPAREHKMDMSSHQSPESLDVFADGKRIHLLATEAIPGESEPGLVHRWSDDNGATWSLAVGVDLGLPVPHRLHRGMDAQIAAAGDHVVAVWTTTGTGFGGSGPLVTAVSTDRGRTWTLGNNPADDDTSTGHSFIDLTADTAGSFHLVWLDSRDGAQGLRYARSDDGGRTWSANITLDSRTCECCWNKIVAADGGIRVLYRDKAPRDMALVSSVDRGRTWARINSVGEFEWDFNGCPHVGGGLAGSAGNLYATVWTGREERSGAYVLQSADGGINWSVPMRIGGRRARATDVAADDRGSIAIVWDDESGADTSPIGGHSIFAITSNDRGKTWSSTSRISLAAADARHPRIVATPGGFRAFWTETWSESGVVWATAPIPRHTP